MQQVQVATADSAASDFEDDVVVLDYNGLRDFDDFDFVLAHPGERLHRLGGMAILAAVASRVCDVLFGGSIAVVAKELLNLGSDL
jgi:hypothetical protein